MSLPKFAEVRVKIAHNTLILVADGEKLLLFGNEGNEKYPVFVGPGLRTEPNR